MGVGMLLERFKKKKMNPEKFPAVEASAQAVGVGWFLREQFELVRSPGLRAEILEAIGSCPMEPESLALLNNHLTTRRRRWDICQAAIRGLVRLGREGENSLDRFAREVDSTLGSCLTHIASVEAQIAAYEARAKIEPREKLGKKPRIPQRLLREQAYLLTVQSTLSRERANGEIQFPLNTFEALVSALMPIFSGRRRILPPSGGTGSDRKFARREIQVGIRFLLDSIVGSLSKAVDGNSGITALKAIARETGAEGLSALLKLEGAIPQAEFLELAGPIWLGEMRKVARGQLLAALKRCGDEGEALIFALYNAPFVKARCKAQLLGHLNQGSNPAYLLSVIKDSGVAIHLRVEAVKSLVKLGELSLEARKEFFQIVTDIRSTRRLVQAAMSGILTLDREVFLETLSLEAEGRYGKKVRHRLTILRRQLGGHVLEAHLPEFKGAQQPKTTRREYAPKRALTRLLRSSGAARPNFSSAQLPTRPRYGTRPSPLIVALVSNEFRQARRRRFGVSAQNSALRLARVVLTLAGDRRCLSSLEKVFDLTRHPPERFGLCIAAALSASSDAGELFAFN